MDVNNFFDGARTLAPQPQTIQQVRGLTLIELLIVLGIVSILGLFAAPGFDALMQSSRSSYAINQLSGLVSYARNEAISYNVNVTICPSSSGLGCDGSTWHDGVVMFTDVNGNAKLEDEDKVRRYLTPFLKGGTLNWRSLRNRVQFNGRGLTRGTAGSFVYCPSNKDERYAKTLIINFQGRARKGPDLNNDGIPETGSRKNAKC